MEKRISTVEIMKEVFDFIFSERMKRIYWPLWFLPLMAVVLMFLWMVGAGLVRNIPAVGLLLLGIAAVLALVWTAWVVLFELRLVGGAVDGEEIDWITAVGFANKNLLRAIGLGFILMGLVPVVMAIGIVLIILLTGAVASVNTTLGGLLALFSIVFVVFFVFYILVRLTLAPYHVFVGNCPVLSGIVEAWRKMKGYNWAMFRLIILVSLASLGINVVLWILTAIVHLLFGKIKVLSGLIDLLLYLWLQPYLIVVMIAPFYIFYEKLMMEAGEEEGVMNGEKAQEEQGI